MPKASSLGTVLSALRKQYGTVEMLEPRTAFALILWENCGYLVDDEKRAVAFAALKHEIGLTPEKILSAKPQAIADAVRTGGMLPAARAEKLRRCAELAIELADGDLDRTLSQRTLPKARALLKRFPGIGDPGADKALLLCGYADVPALDSNGLRVLERLGRIKEDPSYARMYKAGIATIAAARIDYTETFALLRAHGRELCKRTNPICPACPLKRTCPSARL